MEPKEELFDPEDLVDQIDTEESVIDDEIVDEESDLSYEEGVEDGIDAASSEITHVRENSIVRRREDTRSTLAVIYTVSTFIVFILGMGIAVLDGIINKISIVENLTEIIPLISGVFLGSLGFVLGYYFRKGDE